MKIIKTLVAEIKEEVKGLEEYAKKAIHYKTENPTLAKMYYDIAQDEAKHVDMLHAEAVRAIDRQRAISTPPKYMVDMWEEEHAEIIEEVAKSKIMLQMYSQR